MITKEADSDIQENNGLFAINLLLRLFAQPFLFQLSNYGTKADNRGTEEDR